jgi:glutamate/tyrosine decarboxylase-like PLP-dependent enzyme
MRVSFDFNGLHASDQVHGCHRKSLEVLGLGGTGLCIVPTGADCRMDVAALRAAIQRDRQAGLRPACVIATSGTVNTGAIDDLRAIARLCREEGLWFHVDGCIGALVALAPRHRHLVAGIEEADSLALDPHKLLQAPFEVGCCLVRDRHLHRSTFSLTPEYLQGAARGLASGEWLYDYGLQTTRGFRALKLWMSLTEQGADRFGRLIDHTIALADQLRERAAAHAELEVLGNTPLNIVCFRFCPPAATEETRKEINLEIMMRMQEAGIAVISDTTVRGSHWLRAAFANHRTLPEDVEILVNAVVGSGQAILAERAMPARLPAETGT